jgi:hypothetical protein
MNNHTAHQRVSRKLPPGKPRPRPHPETLMKTFSKVSVIALLGSFLIAGTALRADNAKNYQVTGPVLEVTPVKIVVQKGDDRWELARNSDTKVDGDLKVGAKVTIHYVMIASDVKVQADKKK